jgi:hypothetical protein
MFRHPHGRPSLRWAALVAILSSSALVSACSSGSGGGDGSGDHANYGEDVRRPAEPADGAPVALVPFRYGGADELYVEFKAFNYRDTGVTSFAGEVDLLDAEGNVLATQTFSFEGTPAVGPGDDAIMRLADDIPPATVAATFRVQRATLVDLGEWTAVDAPALPQGTPPTPEPGSTATSAPTEAPPADGTGATGAPTDAPPADGTGVTAAPADGTGAAAIPTPIPTEQAAPTEEPGGSGP